MFDYVCWNFFVMGYCTFCRLTKEGTMKTNIYLFCFAALLLSSAWYVQADEEDEDEGDKKKKDKDSVGTVIGIDLGTTYSWWVGLKSKVETLHVDILVHEICQHMASY